MTASSVSSGFYRYSPNYVGEEEGRPMIEHARTLLTPKELAIYAAPLPIQSLGAQLGPKKTP